MSAGGPGYSLLVVAGEASGDFHAASLCAEIQARVPGPVQIWGAGGERLQKLGARLLGLSHQLAAIGPAAAFGQLYHYWALYRSILSEVGTRRPDAAILVDFPDFNLPLARALRRRGVKPIVYFISPQLWAWRQGRVRRIHNDVDQMIVLLPFEVDFYRRHGIQARYFGHPLASRKPVERDRSAFARIHGLDQKKIWVAVLPGSRRREVGAILPLVLEGAAHLPREEQERLVLVIGAAPGLRARIERIVSEWNSRLSICVVDGSEQVLANCDYGLVKSGTSTLEAALAGLPLCVVYRVSFWTWVTAKCLVRTEHYALPNLVLRERAVPELMQWDANPRSVAAVLSSFSRRDVQWEVVKQRLAGVREKLAAEDPYRDAAASVLQLLGAP